MADTSATIRPSLRTPAQRVRHRMECCPRWEWNHCPPSVECAIKQYEKGETFSDEYLELSNKSRPSYDRCNPAYRLLREVQGRSQEENSPELDRLEKAINDVHEKHGLQCGPALTGKSALKAIAHQPEAEKARPIADEPEQLLLLAA